MGATVPPNLMLIFLDALSIDFVLQSLLRTGGTRDIERNYHRHRDARDFHRTSPIGLMRRQLPVCESAPELFFLRTVLGHNQTLQPKNAMCAFAFRVEDYSNVIFMNGGEQLHSILIHIRRHSVEHKGAFCGGNAHE